MQHAWTLKQTNAEEKLGDKWKESSNPRSQLLDPPLEYVPFVCDMYKLLNPLPYLTIGDAPFYLCKISLSVVPGFQHIPLVKLVLHVCV